MSAAAAASSFVMWNLFCFLFQIFVDLLVLFQLLKQLILFSMADLPAVAGKSWWKWVCCRLKGNFCSDCSLQVGAAVFSCVPQMLAKFAEDDRIEQMNAQKRRMKQQEHKRAVENLLEERRAQYAAEREREAFERAEEMRMEEFRKQIVEEERRRLLKEHATRLLGYLPKVSNLYLQSCLLSVLSQSTQCLLTVLNQSAQCPESVYSVF